ncbi:hypothetical protein MWU49_02480 [Alcanivorax sp. S6407]|uniref:hypothetical protein n=1 Tax=Alcanivorax sp. S6407 TaxID=2926424 RepID=UPI001FF1C750|nr:hypothetical protein [Alcanivorax sp. S6407]MCK0152558.1 hypothetical protein [Alcanivorax sp. S6407]
MNKGIMIVLGSIVALQTHALQPLADEEMGNVAGQEGVMVSLEYYYNSVRTTNAATTGAGLASCSNDPNGALADMDCRLSWQLANRGNASIDSNVPGTWTDADGNNFAGEWLVWKAGWASLAVNDLSLDGAFLGTGNRAASSSTGTAIMIDGSGAALSTPVEGLTESSYESWFADNIIFPSEPGKDKGSFLDSSGNCLLGNGGSDCTAAYLRQMPALRTFYPNTGGSYDDTSKSSVGYNDARFGLHVTGLSAEYDDALQGVGWKLNNHDSFTSLTIADNNGHQAGIAFGGNFYLYGF